MAYNFKKINDVPVVEAMKDNLNVFIEDGGKMAKIPANKMIPEDVALKSDIPVKVSDLENDANYVAAPATAEVGQVIAVKAVDENGKPTEWEAVNMDSGMPTIYYTDGNVLYHDNNLNNGVTTEEIFNLNPFKAVVNNGYGISQFLAMGDGYIVCYYSGELHTIFASDAGPS